MINRLETLKAKLESLYNQAINSENNKYFFLWLYDFVKVFDSNPEMDGFSTVIKNEHDQDYKRIYELTTLASKEINKCYLKLQGYIKKAEIKNEVIDNELKEYKMVLDGHYQSSNGYLEDLYSKLTYALMTLAENGSERDLKFTQNFGVISDERRISSWTFSPSFTEYSEIKQGLKEIQETRLWHSWNKVVLAFRAIEDYKKETFKELLNANKHFELLNWSGLQSEMMKILNNKQNPNDLPYEFIQKEYSYYLTKVYITALEYLQSDNKQTETSVTPIKMISIPTEVKWKIVKNDEYLILVINNKEIRYSTGDDGAVLIQAIDDNDGSVFNDDIYEKLSGKSKDGIKNKNIKRKAYDVALAINRRVLNETLVSKFLIKGFDKTGFNPAYTRI